MGRLRWLTAGESHGPGLAAILEGMPAGVAVGAEAVDRELRRRQGGHGRGFRMQIEHDAVRFTGGVRAGRTLGSPVCMLIENKDWAKWVLVMDPAPPQAGAEAGGAGAGERAAAMRRKALTRPRPGHADLAGGMKIGARDLRDVLERASARETAARVAVGALARRLLVELGMDVASHVVALGEVSAPRWVPPGGGWDAAALEALRAAAEPSPVRCADAAAGARMVDAIDRAQEAQDTLGGVFEVVAAGVPPGLGHYVHWDRRLDGRLGQALLSIPAVKAVEVGDGWAAARAPGSQVHDEIVWDAARGFRRLTNRAGGLEGGVSTGEALVVRAAMKPLPTLMKPLRSVDIETKEPFGAARERSDVCALPAAAVIGEAMVALVLADAVLEKFGGDSLDETRRNRDAYLAALRQY
ncbi:MAG TPA: chorismate synthase [Myxococcota bacterium]|nr:chorismate synthase [Myxococcota bacterium]